MKTTGLAPVLILLVIALPAVEARRFPSVS